MFTPGLVKRNTPPPKTWIGLGLLEGGPAHRLEEMQMLLRPVGKVEIKDNILAAKWTKLVVNAMCLGPFAITLGLVGTGFPELVVLNTDEAATDPRYVAARARIELVSTTRDPTCGDSTPRASRCT